MNLQESQPVEAPRQIAAKQALQLWEILLFVSVVMLFALVGITTLRRMRRGSSRGTARPTIYQDAWGESAKRLQSQDEPVVVSPSFTDFDARPEAKTRTGDAPPFSGQRPIVMITGGARRVGASIAETFARAGCDIVLTYFTSEDDAARTCERLRKLGATCHPINLNLAGIERLSTESKVLAKFLPRLDVLVHNASIYEPTPLNDIIADDALRHFRINALAPLCITSALAPLLAKSPLKGGGSVICMSDIHAMGNPQPGFTAYSMSKAALTEMVYSLARELAPHIRVNGVAPGIVQWPEHGAFSEVAEQSKYVRRVPLGRAGEPADAATVVKWLALEATYVTGEIIRVDGGRHIT